MSHIKIIYGTTGGNTELVCQFVAEKLKDKHAVTLERCELTDPKKVTDCDFLILASPTYGHGVLEMHFAQFFPKIQDVDLGGKPCAVITLGDPKYDMDYFLESGKILTEFLETHGGRVALDSLKIAKTPLPYLSKSVMMWVQKLCEILKGNKK
ncbi:flavodoxin family protein [Candidatus Gracilibacteria bacterium]|nr:flavodoxin family protein [Candidatus Gracilibacteria bacterium]